MESVKLLDASSLCRATPQFCDSALANSRVYNWTFALRCANRLIMAATTSLLPVSLDVTLSHTSSMYSQFSEVRFSSVALATRNGQVEAAAIPCEVLTDDIVKSVLLSAKHRGRKYRSNVQLSHKGSQRFVLGVEHRITLVGEVVPHVT